jgi:putative FmdB family regulatory protein
MPIYEYECKDCHQHFELLQKISDEPTGICPHCQGQHIERLVSAAGFQLKGTGWYVTDFRDKKPKSCSTDKTSCSTNSCSTDKGKKSE